MKSAIKYVELKTGFNNDGPAWIGLVFFSKSKKTIYFNGKAFQTMNGNGFESNFYDIETGEEYWISGVKKNQKDRYIYGGGKVKVEARIMQEYLKIINKKEINPRQYEIVELIEELPISRINEIENEKKLADNSIHKDRRFLKPTEMSNAELDYFIEYYQENSESGTYLKARKDSREKMNQLLLENQTRNIKNLISEI